MQFNVGFNVGDVYEVNNKIERMDDIYIFFSSPSLFFLEFMNIDDLPLNLINESATRRGSLGVNRAENRKLLR